MKGFPFFLMTLVQVALTFLTFPFPPAGLFAVIWFVGWVAAFWSFCARREELDKQRYGKNDS